jgi:hypothetical protein
MAHGLADPGAFPSASMAYMFRFRPFMVRGFRQWSPPWTGRRSGQDGMRA